MAEKSWLQRAGLTPAKGAMVVILGLVLVVVVVLQFAGSDPPPPRGPARAKRPAPAQGPATARASSAHTRPSRTGSATAAAAGSSTRTTAPRGKRPPANTGPGISPVSASQLSPQTAWQPWARPSLQRTLQYNPLQQLPGLLPDVEPPAGSESADAGTEPVDPANDPLLLERQAAWQRLHSASVRMIVVGAGGRWAYVGDELVREGDMIDGFVVESIDAQGVRFADPRAGQ